MSDKFFAVSSVGDIKIRITFPKRGSLGITRRFCQFCMDVKRAMSYSVGRIQSYN
jgi:hypothetical protein